MSGIHACSYSKPLIKKWIFVIFHGLLRIDEYFRKKTSIKPSQAISLQGFETAIQVFEQQQTVRMSERTATVIDYMKNQF